MTTACRPHLEAQERQQDQGRGRNIDISGMTFAIRYYLPRVKVRQGPQHRGQEQIIDDQRVAMKGKQRKEIKKR